LFAPMIGSWADSSNIDAPFRDKIKWRTGPEGRINYLKRSYCWNRTELTGIDGARTWCGHGVFAHNLVKISTVAA
jgi:transposase, IS5 family